ncbi:MAG: hypothetical protein RLZZ612_1615 [Pseudomonadota bacterium]|jgi:nucleoside-diphosphate-sugar epimerase
MMAAQALASHNTKLIKAKPSYRTTRIIPIMKLMLTGASGFIGQHVVRVLQNYGIDLIVVGRTPVSSQIPFVKADLLAISDFSILLDQIRPTHLLHLAWCTEHGKYWTSALNLRWLDATIRLVEAFCAAEGQKVVIAGTCAEYDWRYGYCHEDHTPINPGTLYGCAKDATRRMVAALCNQHQIPCVWGRVFFSFGDGEPESRLIPSLVNVFKHQIKPFAINTEVYRDFLHVSDAAEAFMTLLTNPTNGIYNICSGEPKRLADIVITLASLMNVDPEPVLKLSSKRSDDPPLLVGNNLKLRAFGWDPKVDLRQALQLTICTDKNDIP